MPPRVRTTLSLALAIVAFALSLTLIEPPLERIVRQWCFELGAAAGCHYFQSGVYAVGEHGPFFGGDYAPLLNFAWRNFPWTLPTLPPLLLAAVTFRLTVRRPPARDGVTRCGWCGYALSGVREPRCPECGRAV
jgi:hypothetical protein